MSKNNNQTKKSKGFCPNCGEQTLVQIVGQAHGVKTCSSCFNVFHLLPIRILSKKEMKEVFGLTEDEIEN